jgi:ferrochelatase
MTVRGALNAGTARFDDAAREYDAILVMSFGGPEGLDDVMPFLENVTRGRNVPRERLLSVAKHYEALGGRSPINAQNRALIEALLPELTRHGIELPIYYATRNWHPLVTDVMRQMNADGVGRALAFVTSAFSCYSGCRQYRENITEAIDQLGAGAPEIDKIRVFYNHPGFIAANANRVRDALACLSPADRTAARVVFTAHSIPAAMARTSAYESQLGEASRLVAEQVGHPFDLVYQSRSGPPRVPWLGPDILDHLRDVNARGVRSVVVHPIGFLSDHVEVIWDLDQEAAELAKELGMRLVRSASVGTAPEFVAMIRELIEERMTGSPARRAVGRFGPSHDVCPVGCCVRTA